MPEERLGREGLGRELRRWVKGSHCCVLLHMATAALPRQMTPFLAAAAWGEK